MATIDIASNSALLELVEKLAEQNNILSNSSVTIRGDDGISASHSWDGTVLTITSASGTSSADLKGEQGVQGETGNSGVYVGSGDMPENCNVQIDPDGDVIDVEDLAEEIAELVKESSEEFIVSELAKRGQLKPEFVNDVSECTDTTKLYVLPDGYIYVYTDNAWTKTRHTFAPADYEDRILALEEHSVVQTTGDSEIMVMSQKATTDVCENIKATHAVKDEFSAITDGHFWEIPYSFYTNGNYYQEIDGVISVRGQRKSSGIIPAPKNLCLDFGIDGTLNCFLYFYNKNENGEFEVTFDLFKHRLSSGVLNYVASNTVEARMIADIPDDTYMEICFCDTTDPVALFGWDGVPFGMDVCATCSIPVTSSGGTETWLSVSGGSGITVHGKAKHIISKGATMRLVHGFKNGERTQVSGTNKSYLKLPDGYDYFRIRIELTAEGDKKKTLSGNVRDLFYIVAKETEEFPISNAVKVIENGDRICSLTWVPGKNFYAGTQGDSPVFKGNVEYNGLLYSGDWEKAHFVGWHVSPHTFINAMNDVASIAYRETAGEGEKKQPYYGIVCSAFATMCAGWNHPQTNAGFFYDPEIEKYYSHKPQLGQIYTDITSHCVIPCGITQIGNDSIVSVYEAIRPISAKTTRFMSIRYEDIWEWWNGAAGLDYYNNYGYVVHNPRAKADMSFVPYADFENATITNGSARPYKGDKSVYTSEEAVKINIKNDAATILYLKAESGAIQSISLDDVEVVDGIKVPDVKPYLQTSGIYSVYTDADSTEESFEYVEVTPISYTLTDDKLTFSDNDFWYADCHCAGIHYYQNGEDENGNPKYEKRNVSVLANAKGNYAKWFTNGNSITKVNAIFKKGRYGAYTVPIEM